MPSFLNPFVPNAPFLDPMKTSENCVFSGDRERIYIGAKWVKQENKRINLKRLTFEKIIAGK